MPNTSTADIAPFSPAALLVHRRTWVYGGLFLLAVVLLLSGQRRVTPAGSLQVRAAVTGATTSPAARPATQDDRPLLLPDR